jgi:hypothetical protein
MERARDTFAVATSLDAAVDRVLAWMSRAER